MLDARRRAREESRLGLGADVDAGADVKLTSGSCLRQRDWPKKRLEAGVKTHFNNDERDVCFRPVAGQAGA